ncbi:MAG: hypothetical protein B7Y12_05185 [Rhizobiales bacterium 24-66-13]|jgi:O-antigen/teichoic acid export membrane protein|nr:MAG: hypothetical protein B7Y61_03420 [Rhizobiales bacterium 35-66-30]OYZ82027.1 MAG: hypothetical protein B7Y12_05185 [Rhizobiales bacterium 24-66-13]OZB11007.1 MAG: hypothetical protein B7X67_05680 [Rhizobiales bacterium 39-66-18]HQS47108.1 oligosaccharide flippase family protein [Xanthobacteraceae bacterium]
MTRFLYGYLAPVFLINFGNACAYFYQILLARSLSPADVGAFNALLGATTLLAAPAAVAPLTVSHLAMLQRRHDPNASLGPVVALTAQFALISAVGIAAVILLLSPLVGSSLKIENHITIVLFSVLVGLNVIYPVAAGWYQATRRTIAMSAILGGVPILRFVFGVLLVALFGLGLDGALIASLLPCVVVFGAGLAGCWPISFRWRGRLPPGYREATLRFMVPAAIATTLIYALFNLDVILVRMLRPPEESGYYALAAVLGRVPFLFPAALANIFFAEIDLEGSNGKGSWRSQFLRQIITTAAIAIAIAIPMVLFAEPLVILVAGENYLPAVPLLRICALAMASLAVLNNAVVVGMRKPGFRPLPILGPGVLAFVLLCVAFSASASLVAMLLGGTILVMAVAVVAILIC